MELFNNIDKQQNTQFQTEQRNVQPELNPVKEVKLEAEAIKKETDTLDSSITSKDDVKDLVDTLNESLDPFDTYIRFGFDNKDDVFFVSVIDTNTNNIIRRFPAEQAEGLVNKMNEIVGIIFDEKG